MPPTFAAMLGRPGPNPSAPGPGNQGDGVAQLQMIVQWLEKILPLLGTGTPQHQAALKAAEQLTRISAKAGGASLGQQQTLWRDLGQQIQRMGLMAQLNAQQATGRGQGQGPGGPPGGGQQAPPPTGAFPGA
jgi:hypothetical protein